MAQKKSIFPGFVKSRSFWGSLAFAAGIWLYSSLSATLYYYVDIPLEILLPANRAVEGEKPEKISVEVKGAGWQILNLILYSSGKCVVDLRSEKIATSEYHISRADLFGYLSFASGVEATDVNPETLVLKTGLIGKYKVPVKPNVKIQPMKGFTLVGDLKTFPDSVLITGNDNEVKSVEYWETEFESVDGVYSPKTITVELKNSDGRNIELSSENVKIFFDVQQISEKTVYDAPVRIVGGNLPSGRELLPKYITITLKGGVKEMARLDYDSIFAAVDYDQIISDSTGVVVPQIHTPEHISALKAEPDRLLLYRISKSPDLNILAQP